MKKFGRAGSTFATVIAAVVVLAVASTSGAVAGGLITSKQIKNNTIKSKDVKDGNLRGVDIADGSIGSADIQNGGVAKGDLASSARGFTSIVTKSQTAAGIANGNTSTVAVRCGGGSVAIGGGAYVVLNGISFFGATGGVLEASHPTHTGTNILDGTSDFAAGDNVAPDGWKTTVRNDQGATENAVHYAICASK